MHEALAIVSSRNGAFQSILAQAMAPPLKPFLIAFNELRRWCLSHSGELPRCRSDDKTEAALARLLDRAQVRRARACDNCPSGRQLSASETKHLNHILAQPQIMEVVASASASSCVATAEGHRITRTLYQQSIDAEVVCVQLLHHNSARNEENATSEDYHSGTANIH